MKKKQLSNNGNKKQAIINKKHSVESPLLLKFVIFESILKVYNWK